jgi:hypothetical protein
MCPANATGCNRESIGNRPNLPDGEPVAGKIVLIG